MPSPVNNFLLMKNKVTTRQLTPDNRQRIISFDLARGFTVLCMPMVHVVMLYSKPEVQQSLLGDILGFIAEGPGAELFMLLMGVSFIFSKRVTKRYVLQRTFQILAAAYILNFLKFIIPLGLGIMPENLLDELKLGNDLDALNFFLFINDILHFAAIAYLLLYFITRLKHYPYWSLLITIILIFLSPYLWDYRTGITAIDYLIIAFNGHPPQTFFPVFPWLVYPLIGLTLGYLLKHNNHNYMIKKTGIFGLAIILISFCFPATDTLHPTTHLPSYRTDPADTIFHIGFVLVWLSIFHCLHRKVPSNIIFNLLTFCSKQITTIYIIQWILICWCMAITGYLQLDMTYTCIWMICITLTTLILTFFLKRSHTSHIITHN